MLLAVAFQDVTVFHNTHSIIEARKEVNTVGIVNLCSLWDMESWQARFKAHMKAKGLTQETVAERLGMTQGGVGHWLTTRNEISVANFLRLCRAANADPQVILFGSAPTGSELLDEIKKLVKSVPRTPNNAH